MPDIDIFKDPNPTRSIPLLPQEATVMQPKQNLVQLPITNEPLWSKSVSAQVPIRTRLDQTLRYTDPTLGFNPFDTELEYKYADEHYGKTFGNNVIKGVAKLAGTFVEALATIPLAINASIEGDFSKLYDNDLTNDIQDWYETLEVTLPTYKNKNQTEHPVLSWFTGDFTNNFGGAINNLGFTAGAILGTLAEGAIITAMTGGVGTLPAVGANITRFFGRFGRAVAAGAETAQDVGNTARLALQQADDIKLLERGAHQMGGTWKRLPTSERGLVTLTDDAAETAVNTERGLIPTNRGVATLEAETATNQLARHTGTGVESGFTSGANAAKSAFPNKIDKGLNTLFKVTKITDGIRYNLALLTSAMAEGAFEANSVMRNTEEAAKQEFFDKNGYDAPPEELEKIKQISHTAGDFAMGANIAILYASNRINWGSLFKPTKQTTQAAIDGSLFRGYRKFTKSFDKETGLYSLKNATPEGKLGKLLLWTTSPGRKLQIGLVESAEEGAQFIVSEGSTDYAKRKYDGTNRGELADYIKSFNYGVNRTFKSNEGLENLMGGFVGGILGGFLLNKGNALRGVKHQTAKQRLEQQIAGLNKQTFKGVFEHGIAGAAAQQSIAKDYTDAVQKKDLFRAKNLKAEALFNWVNTAVGVNSFEARLDEIDAAKNLKGEEFSKMWGGLEYNEDNHQAASDYLDSIKKRALEVKKDIQKIDRLFNSNPFDKKKQTLDHLAHETWKQQLAANLGYSRDYQSRIKQLSVDINAVIPGLNINEALKMTTATGISEMLTKLSASIDNLGKLENEAKDASKELVKTYSVKRGELEEVFRELQQHVFNGFEAKKFIPTLRKLYQLTTGLNYETNELTNQKRLGEAGVIYLEAKEQNTDDELVDVFESLQDIAKLHNINYNTIAAYNNLLKPRGYAGYADYVKGIINKTNANVNITDNGKVETPVDIERQAEEDAKLRTSHMAEEEGISREEREATNDAIMKQAAGETLSTEEEELLSKYPLYTEKAKTTQAHKEAILKEKTGQAVTPPVATDVQDYDVDESGFRKEISPVELLNKLNSHEAVGNNANKNLFKAIFSRINNFLASGLTAKSAASELKIEQAKNGNVQQKYKAISIFNKTKEEIGKSGIYKSRYERNIEIYHNGEFIGLLKPADSLFLDAQGTRTIYDMKEGEFTAVTGMPKSQYKSYMKELNAYKTAYDGLVGEFNEKKLSIGNDTLLKYFPEIRVNTGNTIFNSGIDKNKDTLIKDLNHRPEGTALISYKTEGNNRRAVIVNAKEIADNNPTLYNNLKVFINSEEFKKQANSTEGRYILVVPVNGEYRAQSMIHSRPAEINTETKYKLLDTIKDFTANFATKSIEQLVELSNALNNTYYIANADRSVKGTKFTIDLNENGSLSLSITNISRNNPYFKVLNIPNDSLAKIKTYEEFVRTLHDAVIKESKQNPQLSKLRIVLKEDSIKYQTLNDADISKLKDVESQIKVATTPDVFANYSVNFYPKGSTKGEARQSNPRPKSPTQQEKERIIEKLKNLQPIAGQISDMDAKFANENPEQFLEFVADQALGMTRDQEGNRVKSDIGNGEAAAVTAYGKEIVDVAKRMFPIEATVVDDAPRPKTAEELEADRQREIKQQADNVVDREYANKKLALHDDFINNLTEAEKKIKDFITKNPIFVGKDVVDVYGDVAKGAGVTSKDVLEYMYDVRVYNVQRAKLNDIAESKKQASVKGSTSTPVISNNVNETSIILQDLFGLSKEESDNVAIIYERNREAWVKNEYENEMAYRKANNGHASKKYSEDFSDKMLTTLTNSLSAAKDKLELAEAISVNKLKDLNKIISDEKTKEKDLQKAANAKSAEEAHIKVLQDDVANIQAQLNSPTKALYGSDLLEFMNKESHKRFAFGKKTEQELVSTDLTQEMTASQIREELENNNIIELNC